MRITIESTTKIVELNGIKCRVWEGMTTNGIKVHCFIPRIACDIDEPRKEEFEVDLKECKAPSPVIENVYPLRMVL